MHLHTDACVPGIATGARGRLRHDTIIHVHVAGHNMHTLPHSAAKAWVRLSSDVMLHLSQLLNFPCRL